MTLAGKTVEYDSAALSLDWYKDSSGQPMVSLKELARCAEWAYQPNGASTIAGHEVTALYTADSLTALTVDGQSFAGSGLVWRNDLYVGAPFLKALGLNVTTQGDHLVLAWQAP